MFWLVNGELLNAETNDFLLETISRHTQQLTVYLNGKMKHFTQANYTCVYDGKEATILVRRRTSEFNPLNSIGLMTYSLSFCFDFSSRRWIASITETRRFISCLSFTNSIWQRNSFDRITSIHLDILVIISVMQLCLIRAIRRHWLLVVLFSLRWCIHHHLLLFQINRFWIWSIVRSMKKFQMQMKKWRAPILMHEILKQRERKRKRMRMRKRSNTHKDA